MKDFKKKFRSDAPRRPSFSNDRRPAPRSFDRSSETFTATCNKCNKACDVPFRPNGKKPVYCRDCFVRDDEHTSRGRDRDMRPSHRGSAPERFSAPRTIPTDPRIDALQQEVRIMHEKLDTLMQNLQNSAYASVLANATKEKEIPAPSPKKRVVAKSKTAPAPAKAPAKKKVAAAKKKTVTKKK